MQDFARLRTPTLQDASEGLDTVADFASQGLARASEGLNSAFKEPECCQKFLNCQKVVN